MHAMSECKHNLGCCRKGLREKRKWYYVIKMINWTTLTEIVQGLPCLAFNIVLIMLGILRYLKKNEAHYLQYTYLILFCSLPFSILYFVSELVYVETGQMVVVSDIWWFDRSSRVALFSYPQKVGNNFYFPSLLFLPYVKFIYHFLTIGLLCVYKLWIHYLYVMILSVYI